MSADDHEADAGRVLMQDDRRAGSATGIASALRELPAVAPPRGAWDEIRRRAETEGLLASPPRRRRRRDLELLAGGALAASLVFALLDFRVSDREPAGVATPVAGESRFAATPVDEAGSLGKLMERSRRLESVLRARPETPRVIRASTAGTIATLEDRIAMIDQQLSFPARPLTDEEARVLWRERVQLMDSLVRLRYAQARRVML